MLISWALQRIETLEAALKETIEYVHRGALGCSHLSSGVCNGECDKYKRLKAILEEPQ